MYATEKQNRGSDCSLIVVSLTTENNRIIHIRKAVAFSDFTFCCKHSAISCTMEKETVHGHALFWVYYVCGMCCQ